jgi:hypothetical protein
MQAGNPRRTLAVPMDPLNSTRQNTLEDIQKRFVKVVDDLSAIHRLLHQEQHVQIDIFRQAKLRDVICLMKRVLSSRTKASGMQRLEKPKLLSGKFCF